ncbi:MAG: NfeD family protein [Candidatus Rokubacteria bacterium]|nr:NfeD family protein [Candidatus Rokubacteria bacterium]
MREVFSNQPAGTQPVGARGKTIEPLSPSGYIRVNGELWRARSRRDSHVPANAPVVVRDADGITLIVEEAAEDVS